MQNIYLVRHGEKDLTPPDPELTAKGFDQAFKTSLYFKDFSDVQIISSPLRRAVQTADAIAKQLKSKVETNEMIRERINFGDDPNQKKEQFLADWKKTTLDRNYVPMLGQSSMDAGQRMKKFLDTLPLSHENIILVSHGGIISDLLRTLFGDSFVSPLLFNRKKNRQFHIDHCSITYLTRSNNSKFDLKLINFIDHL